MCKKLPVIVEITAFLLKLVPVLFVYLFVCLFISHAFSSLGRLEDAEFSEIELQIVMSCHVGARN